MNIPFKGSWLARNLLTRTVSLHDGFWPWSPLSTFPRTTQLHADLVACGRLQIHQRNRLFLTVNWTEVISNGWFFCVENAQNTVFCQLFGWFTYDRRPRIAIFLWFIENLGEDDGAVSSVGVPWHHQQLLTSFFQQFGDGRRHGRLWRRAAENTCKKCSQSNFCWFLFGDLYL